MALWNFRQASVGNELCFLVDAKQFEGVFPVVCLCGGINDEDVGVFAVGFHKALGYHGGNHGFSQTDNIGEKQIIVLHQHLELSEHDRPA